MLVNVLNNFETLTDERVLQVRVRDLELTISGSGLAPLVERLYGELDTVGIAFHPPCYLTDEWLCPEGIPAIGIPFCLAHPRLRDLEQQMMYEVEGGTPTGCLKLLRHECGHALNYAYELYKDPQWEAVFGPPHSRQSDSYSYQPYSRRFVVNLAGNYAQSHPDEDFAETFAVWLNPAIDWRRKYEGWPVIDKLCYIDVCMKRIRHQEPLVDAPEFLPWSANRMRSTLGDYYHRKRKAMGTEFQGFYDDSLRSIFVLAHNERAMGQASDLLRRYRRQIIDQVCFWTGHRKFDIHQLFNRFVSRCDVLDLHVGRAEVEDLIGIAALLTGIASNTLRVKGKG